jgi:hypothetical protein
VTQHDQERATRAESSGWAADCVVELVTRGESRLRVDADDFEQSNHFVV